MPKISVVLPVHNPSHGHFVDSLSSLLVAACGDVEVLVGIDGEIDCDIENILDIYSQKFAKLCFRVYKYPRIGLVNTLNLLIKESDSLFIARHDADDYCLSHRFNVQSKVLTDFPNVDFCGSQITRCDSCLRPLKRQREFPTSFKGQLLYSSFLNNPIAHPTLMIKRDVFEKVEYRDFRGAEDWDLYIQLWEQGYRSINLHTSCLLYRLHHDQLTKRERDLNMVSDFKRRSFGILNSLHQESKYLRHLQYIASSHTVTNILLKSKTFFDLT